MDKEKYVVDPIKDKLKSKKFSDIAIVKDYKTLFGLINAAYKQVERNLKRAYGDKVIKLTEEAYEQLYYAYKVDKNEYELKFNELKKCTDKMKLVKIHVDMLGALSSSFKKKIPHIIYNMGSVEKQIEKWKQSLKKSIEQSS